MALLSNLQTTAFCLHCGLSSETRFESHHKCSHCRKPLFNYVPDGPTQLQQCFCCGSEHLYRQKDFNRKLGIALVVLGALLSFWTYGLSLIVVALIDLLLYRLVGDVVCCYNCHTQYRGPKELITSVPTFNLSLQDYYENLRRNRVEPA